MADAITVSCPSCRTTFPVDPDKVPVGGVNARCSDCQDIFRVEAPLGEVSAEPAEPGDVGPSPTEAELPGAAAAPPSEQETVAVEDEIPAAEGEPEEAGPVGLEEEEADVGEEAAGFDDYFTRAEEEAGAGTVGTEEAPEEEAPTAELPALDEAAPSAEEAAEPLPGLEDEAGPGEEDQDEEDLAEPLPGLDEAGMEGPELEEPGFETPVIETEEPGEAAAAAPEEPAVAEDEQPAVAEAEEPVVAQDEPTVEKPRPTFGNRSPEEKAQRLARVLVSDMITYNPTMYETALARGTLKEDFADEIEKSWDEYVEQVGEELANSTSHWTDALNDILAKGEKTF